MNVILHEQAAKEFDSKALALHQAVRTGTRSSPVRGSWMPDIPVVPVSGKDLLGPVRVARQGPIPYIGLDDKGKTRYLEGAPAAAFSTLTIKLWQAIKPRQAVSLNAVQRLANQWLLDESTDQPLSAYCLQRLSQLIKKLTVWVPVAELHIQTPFKIGTVDFQTITRSLIASCLKSDSYGTMTPESREDVKRYCAEVEKELQGKAAGVVAVEAEEVAARELALDRVGDALSMLRLFAGPALMPRLISHCAPVGQERIDRYHVLHIEGGIFVGEHRGFVEDIVIPWYLGTSETADLKKAGLQRLGELMVTTKRSDFQDRAMTSLRLFSESTRDSRMTTRLILVLASLEGLFLKDSSEPIVQNLSERLAILSENDVTKRLTVVKLVRNVYAQRSQFVHHSEHLEINEDIEHFATLTWTALMAVIANIDRFDTLQAFVGYLDHLKMSGQPFGSKV